MSTFKKLDHVDALRGLAILMVLLVHCAQYGNNAYPDVFHHIFANGAMGVQLFYVMSAFTLFLSCQRRLGREQRSNRNFFIRRFFRIAPMYYLGILYYLWQNGRGPSYWLGDASGVSDGNILSNVLFVHGVNPYWINSVVPGGWSITVEMCFYLLIPFLFKWIKSLDQAFKFFLIFLGIRLLLHAFFIEFPMIDDMRLWKQYLFFYLPSQMPVFMVGIMLFFLVRGDDGDRTVRPLYLMIFAVVLIIHLATRREVIVPTHVLFAFGFLLLGLALSRFPFKAIVNPVIRHIGKVSYSMYLAHFAVLHWVDHLGFADLLEPSGLASGLMNYSLRYALVVMISVVISTLLYHTVELPMMRVGRRLIGHLSGEKPVPVEA